MYKKLLTRERGTFLQDDRSILLYGAEHLGNESEEYAETSGFHRKYARYITHRHNRPKDDGTKEMT
jgi:hypothetical protein